MYICVLLDYSCVSEFEYASGWWENVFSVKYVFFESVCVWENAFSKPCVIVEDIYNVCSKDVCFLRLVCLWENVFPVSLTETKVS